MQKPPDLDAQGNPILPVSNPRPPDIPAETPVETTTPVQQAREVEEDEADSFIGGILKGAKSFGSKVLATAYGEDDSVLPAYRGITRPLLPKSGEGDWEGWGDMKWLYDNVARPSSSAIGATADWLGGKVVGGAIKGYRGLRGAAKAADEFAPTPEMIDSAINVDPNLNSGMGNPELAGSVPYKAEKPLTPPVNVTPQFGQPKSTPGIPTRAYSNTIPTPEDIAKAKKQGFEFNGKIDDRGRYVYTKVADAPIPAAITPEIVPPVTPTVTPKKRRGRKPNNASAIGTEVGEVGPKADLKKTSTAAELINLPRAIMASNDLSAPLRQGLGLIHKKAFWKAIPDMFRAYGSENTFRALQEEIANRDFHKKVLGEIDELTGKPKLLPSFAERSGLKLTDLTDLSHREEALMSTWAESGIPLGKAFDKIGLKGVGDTLQSGYANTAGRMVRAGNRAYTIFLNKLRADTFDSLVKTSKVFSLEGVDVDKAKALAEFVNTATGRGSLGQTGEKAAVALNSMFFSPRLIASRVKLPAMLISKDATVRKEALKSLGAIFAFGNTITQLGKFGLGGSVETDPSSADFMKLKIGNVRVDPWGGFQQYMVLLNRLSPQSVRVPFAGTEIPANPLGGRFKSSGNGQEFNYSDLKFGRDTRKDTAENFLVNKTNPALSFAYGLLTGRDPGNKKMPFNQDDELARRFAPILLQDIIELATENPEFIPGIQQLIKGEDLKLGNVPLAIPSAFGMSVQKYYDRGRNERTTRQEKR